MQQYIELIKSKQLVPYPEALKFMEDRVLAIHEARLPEALWLLEHPSIYTAGTSAKEKDLLSSSLPVYKTGRGGEFTYHGPGQRVAYVMLDLKKHGSDLKKYIFNLEEWIIQTLKSLNITGERKTGRVGIWVCHGTREEKIAAIGIRVRKWISFHGIAINLNPDLNMFNGIVPCGIKEYGVTSFVKENLNITMNELDKALIENFEKVFKQEVKYV